MLSRRVHFSIESGSFDTGFSVSLNCFDQNQNLVWVKSGKLPANPELFQVYQTWKALYLRWGRSFRLDPILSGPTNVSFLELVQEAAEALEQKMNQWLNSDAFAPIRKKIYQCLSAHPPATLFLQTQNYDIQRLPWSCWGLFDEFPWANFALAPTAYEFIAIRYPQSPLSQVSLLAVLTGGDDVDTQADHQLLQTLPQTSLDVMVSPTRQAFTDSFWKKRRDILFFAGHSSSERGQGKFIIDQDQWMLPSDMKFAIQEAAKQGLKLAIFNSCDGLAIAHDLVNNVPFIITMREPVPDEVAHTFLSYFLNAYSTGKSLLQALKEAQQRLESLEDRFPCATWLPVLVCNPLVVPPNWACFLGQADEPQLSLPTVRRMANRLRPLMFLSLILLILLGRSLGMMQSLELWSFDQLMQRRPQEIQDSRLLIVEIDEAAVREQETRVGSISDKTLNHVIQILSRHQPRVIGVDIYRDHPLDPILRETFQTSEDIVGICKSPDVALDRDGVAAPAGLPLSRVGFSDVLEDPDGVVRRQILFMTASPTKSCATGWSLSSVVALRYLAQEQIPYGFSHESHSRNQQLTLNGQAVQPIRTPWGGYRKIDSAGNQVMLNYRAVSSLKDIAEVVQVKDLLQNNVLDQTIRNRVVLIGVTANTSADFWETPYGATGHEKIPGIFLQAHMVSQLISAAKDQRPLIYAWPSWLDILWISAWGLIGVAIPRHLSLLRWGLLALCVFMLIFLCVLGLLGGLWIPFIPSLIALLTMGLHSRKSWHLNKFRRRLSP